MLLAAPAAMRPLLSPFERWRPSPNARQLPGLGLGLALGLGLGRLPERPRWDAAGTLLGRCWDAAGALLGRCWDAAGTLLGCCWDAAGTLLRQCWDAAGTLLGRCWGVAGTLLGRCWDTAGTLLGDSGTRSETLGTKMMVFQWFYKHSWRLTRRRPFEKKDPLGFHTQRTLRTQHAEAVH